ncbi:MAG: hypothetical protein KDA60_22385, partial [Planctomycetales bacterium]|nr:hypothetical protein [Planctomycetales bacterium]
MTRLNNTMLAAVLVTLLGANLTSAQSFRGVPWIQTDAHGLTNEWLSPALGRGAPWYIDIQDNFDRSSALANSVADTWSVGFVPPRDTNQRGRLSADLTADVGRWDADASLMVTDGVVRLATDIGKGRATMPWRVMPGLGDDYLLDLNTVVAAGETVTLAFYGDVNAVGSETDEDSTVGVLVLDVNRGTGADINTVTWKVSWDAATGRQTFANTKQVSLEEELRLQLAWLDDKHEANDL